MKQYQETEPPYRWPDGLNVFSWSLPFLAEKVSSMLYTIVKKCSDIDEGAGKVNMQEALAMGSNEVKQKKREVIKGKI